MRYSIPMKFLAVLLCACALLVSLGSGLLVAYMTAEDVYTAAAPRCSRFYTAGAIWTPSLRGPM